MTRKTTKRPTRKTTKRPTTTTRKPTSYDGLTLDQAAALAWAKGGAR